MDSETNQSKNYLIVDSLVLVREQMKVFISEIGRDLRNRFAKHTVRA